MHILSEQLSLFQVPASAHIDRLTILGKVSHMEKFASEMACNPYILSMKEAKYPYAYAIKCVDGSYMALASEVAEVPNFRFDFNPSKVDIYSTNEILRILSKVRSMRFSRIDIAIDYQCDLSNVEWIENRSRKRSDIKSGSGRLETLYMGSFKSDTFLRIYDKGLESKLDYPLWRVESQVRVRKGDKPFAKNPFEGLLGRARAPSAIRSISECAMLEYLNNHPLEIATLEPRMRAKYRALMKEDAIENGLSPTPSEVYLKEKGRLKQEASDWLAICKRSKQATKQA